MKIDIKIAAAMIVVVVFIGAMLFLQFSSPAPAVNSTANASATTFIDTTFTKKDLAYGPQSWRPYASKLPITANASDGFYFMLIDLYASPGDKPVQVDYEFKDLSGMAAFYVYGFSKQSNEGSGMSWTNRIDGNGVSGYYVYGKPSAGASEIQELPDSHHVYLKTANPPKYDMYGNGTYYMAFEKAGGGLNKLHITVDPAQQSGQVTYTNATAGTFYLTNTGDAGMDDAVLMVAINSTLPDSFELHIRSS